MFISAPVTGNKISLRPFEEADMELWSVWDMDEEVQNYMPEPRAEHASLSDQMEYFADCAVAEDELHATIVSNETGLAIGTVALTEINFHHGVAELGIVIGNKTQWGKGLAAEAVQLLLEQVEGVRRVSAEYEKGNVGVRKLLEKTGFEFEALCLRSRIKDGKEIDTVRMVKFL